MRAPGSIVALMHVKTLGVVNNREPLRSEITQSDTLRLGGQAQQIEMSAMSMAGVLQWQH